jgi:hypothetical protein
MRPEGRRGRTSFRGTGILPMRRGAIPLPSFRTGLALWRMDSLHGQDARDTHGRDAHATGWGASIPPLFFFVLALLFAGVGFGAQPAARKLLPETAILDRVDGKITHVDANDTWLFELTQEVKTPDYTLPAGTRFVLLPSATLGRLAADVNDRAAPLYRLSARVTQYRGKNYLFPTYYLPLSKFKEDGKPEGGGQKTEGSSVKPPSGTPELVIPPEVLEQLKKQRPPRGPRRKTEPPQPAAAERVLVDCVGLIESPRLAVLSPLLPVPSRQAPLPNWQPTAVGARTGLVFVPYALGWNVSNIRYELLPSRALEEAVQTQTQALDPLRFNVAGLATEFQGKKYLLLQRAIIVYNYGNF